MAAGSSRPRLLAIVGPTASGKSDLALWAAKKFNGEIIAADSRTIYKDINIGTAKASPAEQLAVPHWGLDLVVPGQRFTAKDFQDYAKAKILEIQNRGHLPILVGGTGLYIDAVLYGFRFSADANLKQRQKLDKLAVNELQKVIANKKYAMPRNQQNKRHLVRAIEAGGKVGTRRARLAGGILLLGLMPEDEILKTNISRRAEKMFSSGVLSEARQAIEQYGFKKIAEHGLIYKFCAKILNDEISHDEAIDLFKIADWQYARRQKTWFKRNPEIKWVKTSGQAKKFILTSQIKGLI